MPQSSELIINPDGSLYHIALSRADNIPTNILLVGDPARAHEVANLFDYREGQRQHREFVTIWGIYKNIRVAVMGTGIGTDNTEIASAELHALHEFNPETNTWAEEPVKRNIIRIGTSASPQKDIPLGSIGISEYGLGLDNTGLSYLKKPYEEHVRLEEIYFTEGDAIAKGIHDQIRNLLDNQVIHPYVSKATPEVVKALKESAFKLGLAENEGAGFYTGITSSAPGFFGPQGRKIGRLSHILIPDLQEKLAAVSVDGRKVVNNEMESSALFRINGEVLGDNVGAVCAIIANRAQGEFITPEGYQESVRNAIMTALESLRILNQ